MHARLTSGTAVWSLRNGNKRRHPISGEEMLIGGKRRYLRRCIGFTVQRKKQGIWRRCLQKR